MNGTADKDSKTCAWYPWRPWRLGGEAVCRFALAAASVALFARAADAASLSLTVSPRSVEVGETVSLKISLTGVDPLGNPEFSLPPGAQVALGPSTSQMHRFNGRRSTMTVQYTYRLVFSKAGNYTLGAATIRTPQGVFRSNQAAINVRSAGKLTGVAVTAELEPARVYVGQAVVATFVFGINREIRDYKLAVPFLEERQGLRLFDPENLAERWNEAVKSGQRGLRGHSLIDVATPRGQTVAKEERREIGGLPYKAFVIRRVIVPQEPGTYDFGRARADASIVTGKKRVRSRFGRDPFFDDFFSSPFDDMFGRTRYRTRTVFATSDALKLEVLRPPEEGRPAGYEGAVGRYEIEARVTPRETTLGGPPFELTLTVRGEGNIETVAAPRLPESGEFRLGVAEQEQESRFEKGKLRGEKRFVIPLRPSSARLKEIPPATLVAFDPVDERYVTLTTEPVAVTVTVPEDSGALETVRLPEEAEAERRAREVVREDIEDIETAVDAGDSHEAWLHSAAGIVVFGLIPVCAYVGLAVYAARWRKLREDETFARRASAERRARARLEELRVDTESLGTAGFAEGLARALQGYLADKLGRPAGEIPPAEAESLLRDAGVAEASAREFAGVLEEAEAARFGGGLRHAQGAAVVSLSNGGGEVDRDEWLARAAGCVEAIEGGRGP